MFQKGVIVCILCLQAPAVFAYLDPGSGSILLQAVVGGISAGLAVITLYWNKLKSFLFGRKRVKSKVEKNDKDDQASHAKK